MIFSRSFQVVFFPCFLVVLIFQPGPQNRIKRQAGKRDRGQEDQVQHLSSERVPNDTCWWHEIWVKFKSQIDRLQMSDPLYKFCGVRFLEWRKLYFKHSELHKASKSLHVEPYLHWQRLSGALLSFTPQQKKHPKSFHGEQVQTNISHICENYRLC